MITLIKNKIVSGCYNVHYAANGFYEYGRILAKQKAPLAESVALVVVGRNDDYMPDFYSRLRSTLAWNVKNLVSEPIFVEWNPPSNRNLLAFQLAKDIPSLKAFVVSNTIHNHICENKNLALMEYHAKNVGIKRAVSKWIIASNADIALSPGLISSCRNLVASPHCAEQNIALIAERVDIDWAIGRNMSIRLTDCIKFKKIISKSVYGTGDFLMALRPLWHKIRGYDETLSKHRIGCDVRGAAQMIAHGANTQILGQVLHLAHPTSCTEDGVQPHHGELATVHGVPYENGYDWGLANYCDKMIGERVWLIG